MDDLIDEAMLDGVLGRLAVGRVLGGGVMLTNKLTDFYRNASTTGFEQKYIDHQGGYAYAHIQGMAGAYLIGGEPLLPGGTQTGLDRAQQQWDEDITQHADALVHHQPDLIAEKISELNDDQAGLDVGAILGNYIDGKTSRENARDQIFKMLCDF